VHRGGTIRNTRRAVLIITAALAAPAFAPRAAQAVDFEFSPARIEASYTADDNVNRGSAGETLSDRILGVRVSKGLLLPVSTHTRAVVQGFAGDDKFFTYDGLTHSFFGGQGDFQYRSSGEFAAATYSAFFRAQAEYFQSNLRDGYRYAYGLTALKPVTDRVQILITLQQNTTDAKSDVFDVKNTGLRGNVDWSFTRADTVYLGVEYRKGDTVSTGVQTLARINEAEAIVQDDAFNNPALFAYRFKASAWLATLGYNHAFAERHSLDISWRYATAKPQHPPSSGSESDLEYVVNQISLAYLLRF
jgi:hypothetical protein